VLAGEDEIDFCLTCAECEVVEWIKLVDDKNRWLDIMDAFGSLRILLGGGGVEGIISITLFRGVG
jgi:hypothetical protein